jgi:hypothetical protein
LQASISSRISFEGASQTCDAAGETKASIGPSTPERPVGSQYLLNETLHSALTGTLDHHAGDFRSAGQQVGVDGFCKKFVAGRIDVPRYLSFDSPFCKAWAVAVIRTRAFIMSSGSTWFTHLFCPFKTRSDLHNSMNTGVADLQFRCDSPSGHTVSSHRPDVVAVNDEALPAKMVRSVLGFQFCVRG